MKKITLLFLMLLAFTFGNAQETISFEAPAYTLGDVYGQNGWTTTGDGAGGFITNQVISDEQSSDGSYSVKIVPEAAFGGQDAPVVGAFYDYATPVSYVDAVFSADLYLDTFDSSTTSDFIFGFVNLTDGAYITYVRFTYTGDISVLADDGTGTDTIILDDTLTDWTPLTWFNLRTEFTAGGGIEVFIDDVSIYTGLVATPNSDVEQFRFSHDNYGGFAHMDNFRTNDEELSIAEFDLNSFTHFYNNNTKQLKLNSPQNNLNNVEIYDVLGKRVINKNMSGNEDSIELSTLKNGIYLARVNTENGTKTIKFIKS
ncbi:T9SS type A sorting domain-containing protein [Psychroserpens luteus]|uniref:T9SS type A sorting domain-containing protein n=1 Tax=Psychroserpens luteus TaxID=1434066 RepID=A0ABW5ZRE3_9FLAO|nr:T9SS type A sorting domain-containing protein [Psychroserpens luteus]